MISPSQRNHQVLFSLSGSAPFLNRSSGLCDRGGMCLRVSGTPFFLQSGFARPHMPQVRIPSAQEEDDSLRRFLTTIDVIVLCCCLS